MRTAHQGEEFTDVSSSTLGQQILKWTRTVSSIIQNSWRKKVS